MGGRMNWERARKENLAHVHGYAKERTFCTCGKSPGFTGQHKKHCPMSRAERCPSFRSIVFPPVKSAASTRSTAIKQGLIRPATEQT